LAALTTPSRVIVRRRVGTAQADEEDCKQRQGASTDGWALMGGERHDLYACKRRA
jgi:hypothetical protein